ncbi:MAG: hypothetical protein HRU31_01345 [Rhodobacteraceae bacterium]|nr:hypothetical protein [Paracoccaceae bacterium]
MGDNPGAVFLVGVVLRQPFGAGLCLGFAKTRMRDWVMKHAVMGMVAIVGLLAGSVWAADGEGEFGPDVRGRHAAEIKRAIAEVEVMQFMSTLSDEEVEILGGYLRSVPY